MSSANSNTAELGARMTMSEVGKQKAAESDIHDFLREAKEDDQLGDRKLRGALHNRTITRPRLTIT